MRKNDRCRNDRSRFYCNYLSFVKEIFRWWVVWLSMSWKMTFWSRNMVLYASHMFHSFICLPQHVKFRFLALFLLLSRFHPSHLYCMHHLCHLPCFNPAGQEWAFVIRNSNNWSLHDFWRKPFHPRLTNQTEVTT